MLRFDSRCLVGFCKPAKLSSASRAHPEVRWVRAWLRVVTSCLVEKPKWLELREVLREVLRELTGFVDRLDGWIRESVSRVTSCFHLEQLGGWRFHS